MGSNRLNASNSAYLKQHANNPINWWPWCNDAFSEAKTRDVPIFLSVGYSACHWCHVMAHESFEDAKIASFLNDNYVCIKVDREEHPDVDQLYMEALQAISGSGGWPMSVFLEPNGVPFYAGTYFPPHEGTSIPSFSRVITELSRAFQEDRDSIVLRSKSIYQSLTHRAHALQASNNTAIDYKKTIRDFVDKTLGLVDNEWGGVGKAPKFLQPHLWMSVLDLGVATGDARLINALTTTLDSAISGGMYDQIGGGFARYSTDSFWMVPHFEKMLYDQALNARLYLRAFIATGNSNYQYVATQTIDFVIREMMRADGLFASSQDADTQGHEGQFYIFDFDEIEQIVGHENMSEFKQAFGVTKSGNFEGQNILHRTQRGNLHNSAQNSESIAKMYKYRTSRYELDMDSKAVVEWNAMFIATLAEASFYLNRPDYLSIARSAFQTIFDNAHLDTKGTRLVVDQSSRYEDTLDPAPAVFGDYIQMLDAALSLVHFSGDYSNMIQGSKIFNSIMDQFYDPKEKRFLTTSSNSQQLIVRQYDLFDSSYASSNSTAVQVLLKMSHVLNDANTKQIAFDLIESLSQLLVDHPNVFPVIIGELAKQEVGILEVAFPRDAPKFSEVIRAQYLPNAVLATRPTSPDETWDNRATNKAYVCLGNICFEPVDSPHELAALLNSVTSNKLCL